MNQPNLIFDCMLKNFKGGIRHPIKIWQMVTKMLKWDTGDDENVQELVEYLFNVYTDEDILKVLSSLELTS